MTPFTPPDRAQLRSFRPGNRLIWHDFAELWLEGRLGRMLDYGCGDGTFLSRVGDRASERWGVDVDPDKIAKAGEIPGVEVRRLLPDQPLPFPDARFDFVSILEVIEHVADERGVLSELSRVLAPGGRLLLTTPHKGLLTFLDPGNMKFVAPRAHKFIHVKVLRRPDFYEQNFGEKREASVGMKGDFTTDQDAWHRHYRYRQIRALAPAELETLAWAVYYPAFRAIWTMELALRVLSRGRIRRHPAPIRWLDDRLSRCETRMGDQLVVLFRKRGGEAAE